MGEALQRVVRQVALEAAGVVVELPRLAVGAVDDQEAVRAEVDGHVGEGSAGDASAAGAVG